GKRAATLQLKRLDNDHPDRQHFASEISELASSRELMLDLLVADKLTKVMEAREAELAAEDEWAEDDYIQSLRDAWEDGLKEKYFSDDRDEESERVLNELKRFNEQLEKRIESERRGFHKEFEEKSDDELFKLAVDKIIDTQADLTWLSEYRRCEIWLGTRDPDDHSVKE